MLKVVPEALTQSARPTASLYRYSQSPSVSSIIARSSGPHVRAIRSSSFQYFRIGEPRSNRMSCEVVPSKVISSFSPVGRSIAIPLPAYSSTITSRLACRRED